jgi:hypothetical protein
MAIPIQTLGDLQQYVRSLQANSLHHATKMLEVFPQVLVAALGRMDAGSLYAKERCGKVKNAAWCSINGKDFFFTYCHDTDSVLVRKDNMQGKTVTVFSVGDTFAHISKTLAAL